jgi:hypothetical protein
MNALLTAMRAASWWIAQLSLLYNSLREGQCPNGYHPFPIPTTLKVTGSILIQGEWLVHQAFSVPTIPQIGYKSGFLFLNDCCLNASGANRMENV